MTIPLYSCCPGPTAGQRLCGQGVAVDGGDTAAAGRLPEVWGGGQGEGPADGDRPGSAGRRDAGDPSVAQTDLRMSPLVVLEQELDGAP